MAVIPSTTKFLSIYMLMSGTISGMGEVIFFQLKPSVKQGLSIVLSKTGKGVGVGGGGHMPPSPFDLH